MVGYENGSWCLPAAETDKAFHEKCSVLSPVLPTLFSPYQPILPSTKVQLGHVAQHLIPLLLTQPRHDISTGAGYVSFLKAEREHDVGGTELRSSQGMRGVYYKLHILSKRNGISWNRQTDICCLDFYHLQAVHTKSRTLNQVWDSKKERAKASQLSKSRSFKKVHKEVIGSQKNEASS